MRKTRKLDQFESFGGDLKVKGYFQGIFMGFLKWEFCSLLLYNHSFLYTMSRLVELDMG